MSSSSDIMPTTETVKRRRGPPKNRSTPPPPRKRGPRVPKTTPSASSHALSLWKNGKYTYAPQTIAKIWTDVIPEFGQDIERSDYNAMMAELNRIQGGKVHNWARVKHSLHQLWRVNMIRKFRGTGDREEYLGPNRDKLLDMFVQGNGKMIDEILKILEEDTHKSYEIPDKMGSAEKQRTYQDVAHDHMHDIMLQLTRDLAEIKERKTSIQIKTAIEKGREIQRYEESFGFPSDWVKTDYSDDEEDDDIICTDTGEERTENA